MPTASGLRIVYPENVKQRIEDCVLRSGDIGFSETATESNGHPFQLTLTVDEVLMMPPRKERMACLLFIHR